MNITFHPENLPLSDRQELTELARTLSKPSRLSRKVIETLKYSYFYIPDEKTFVQCFHEGKNGRPGNAFFLGKKQIFKGGNNCIDQLMGPWVKSRSLKGENYDLRLKEIVNEVRGFNHVMEIYPVENSDGEIKYLVMKRMEDDIEQYAKKLDKARLSRAEKMTWMKEISMQIVRGVKYLHDHKICHFDIKPSNLLLNTRNSLEMRLGDFDLAERFILPSDLGEVVGSFGYVCREGLVNVLKHDRDFIKSCVSSFLVGNNLILKDAIGGFSPLISRTIKQYEDKKLGKEETVEKIMWLLETLIPNHVALRNFEFCKRADFYSVGACMRYLTRRTGLSSPEFDAIIMALLQTDGTKRPSMEEVLEQLNSLEFVDERLEDESCLIL